MGYLYIKPKKNFFPFLSHEASFAVTETEFKNIYSSKKATGYIKIEKIKSILRSILRQFRPVNKSIKTPVFSLVSKDSKGYSHWILEELPKLKYFEKYIKPYYKNIKILIDSDVPKWKIETLRLLGYSYPKNFLHHDVRGTNYSKLICCSPLHYGIGHTLLNKNALFWLKTKIFRNIKLQKKKLRKLEKIYISRSDSKNKKIINEVDVIKALKKQGFKIYILSKMSFKEKIKLFYRARIIVAPHGGGLAHILFSEKCKIIEIFPNRVKYRIMYYNISKLFKNSYQSIICEDPSTKKQKKNDNIYVNINDLLNLITK
tara:strand:+ start:279 stop:1226 length:948 start_codon:yes stop_codon:yes gene_type:complete